MSFTTGTSLLLAGVGVRDVEPVPVAQPTRELGVGVSTFAVMRAAYARLVHNVLVKPSTGLSESV